MSKWLSSSKFILLESPSRGDACKNAQYPSHALVRSGFRVDASERHLRVLKAANSAYAIKLEWM